MRGQAADGPCGSSRGTHSCPPPNAARTHAHTPLTCALSRPPAPPSHLHTHVPCPRSVAPALLELAAILSVVLLKKRRW